MDYTNKAKIPIDLATLRDFLFYLIFGLATSFLIVCYKFTCITIISQEISSCFFRELFSENCQEILIFTSFLGYGMGAGLILKGSEDDILSKFVTSL